MFRRLPAVGVAAALVAGAACWFTRATLDVVSTSRGITRVATFPSWPELVGLLVLACLLLVLGRALVRRVERRALPHVSPAERSVPADVLVPLFAAGVLAVPYLPWVPDAVPAVTALAGPGATLVWAIVVGHVVWVGWDAWLHRRAHAWRFAGWPGTLVVALVTGGIAWAAAARLAEGPLAAARLHARPHDVTAAWAVTVDGPQLTALLALATGAAAALQWRAAARLTTSSTAATLGWLATALTVPLILPAFAGSPSVVVALLLLVAVVGTGRASDLRPPVLVLRGVSLGLLVWVTPLHAPVCLLLAALMIARLRAAGAAGWWFIAPYLTVASAAVLAWRGQAAAVWVIASAPDTSFARRALAMLADQEHGVLLYVPALLAAGPGVWRLWRDGGASRWLAVEIAASVLVVLLTMAAVDQAWRHPYVPGEALAPVLPLLALSIARWDRHVQVAAVRRALLRLLISLGLAISGSVLLVRDGALLLANRDGLAEWLVWLSPGYELARVLPALTPAVGHARPFWLTAATWTTAILIAAWIARRWRDETPGRAAVVATGIAVGVVVVSSVLVSVLAADRLAPRLGPGERASSPALQAFDARKRPIGVVYDPWRIVPASYIPELYSFDAVPGLRRQPQPLAVLLNARLSLPAGTYRATITPREGASLRGAIGLQVGRVGPPMQTWHADAAPGHSWTTRFHLHVDASFVGVRVGPELERAVASLQIVPVAVADASRRPQLPPVLSAARYGDVTAYFHDEHVYPERAGFWVRGSTTALVSLAWDEPRLDQPRLTLKLHSGAAPNDITLATRTWQASLALAPGEPREVHVPARPDQRLLQLRIAAARGFVPAEHDGGTDRRELGGWIEILP